MWNLKNNIETIQKITETKQLCFRTINQKLIQKIQKDFPNSKLFDPNQFLSKVNKRQRKVGNVKRIQINGKYFTDEKDLNIVRYRYLSLQSGWRLDSN